MCGQESFLTEKHMKSRNHKIYESVSDVHFITTTIAGFVKVFNDKRSINIVIDCLRFYQDRGDLKLLAYVIMPNHIHLILKTKGKSVSEIMAGFKRFSSKQIQEYLIETNQTKLLSSLSNAAKHETVSTKVWKHRYDCMTIVSNDMLVQKVRYIHNNPVAANLVSDPINWPYSSVKSYLGFDGGLLEVDVDWECI
jgi:REP element-mobilizing transposase RayT